MKESLRISRGSDSPPAEWHAEAERRGIRKDGHVDGHPAPSPPSARWRLQRTRSDLRHQIARLLPAGQIVGQCRNGRKVLQRHTVDQRRMLVALLRKRLRYRHPGAGGTLSLQIYLVLHGNSHFSKVTNKIWLLLKCCFYQQVRCQTCQREVEIHLCK